MKKVIMLAFVLVFITTACSGGETSKQDNAGDEGKKGGAREFGRPDFGQPEEPANIRGLVNSIVGNEVTVLMIETPRRDADGEQRVKDVEEDASETKKAALGTGTTGRMPGMGGGRGMRGGGTADADVQAQMLEKMKEMASGEETFIIPVGIQMLKPGEDSDRREPSMVEATLEDIKKDTMIQVWLDESVEDRQVAKFVLVMN